MRRTNFLSVIIGLGLLVLFTSKIEAVEIRLEDQAELNTISVVVNSGEKIIPGVDLTIIGSDNIEIKDIYNNRNLCKMLFSSDFTTNTVSIECLNDLENPMNGVIATFKYLPRSDDYYFYVDQENLDIGAFTLNSLNNINYSNDIQVVYKTDGYDYIDNGDTATTDIKNRVDDTLDKVIQFLKKYSIYLLEGAILLILSIILVSLLLERSNDSEYSLNNAQ